MNKEQRIDFAQSRATETYPQYRWAAGSSANNHRPRSIQCQNGHRRRALDQPTFEAAVDLMARRIVDEFESFFVLDDFED